MTTSEPTTLFDQLVTNGRGEHCALQQGALKLSYAELLGLVETTGAQLLASGVEPSDRVLLMFPNSVELVIAALAVGGIAAVAVPVDWQTPAERLGYVIGQTTPSLCLVDEAAPDVPAVEVLKLRISADDGTPRFTPARPASNAARPPVLAEQAAFIRFTSGSTGNPKGVVLNHAQQLWTACTLSRVFDLGEDHRELLLVSMALSGGWQRVAATLVGGGCVVIAEGPLSVQGMLEQFEAQRATGFFTPPPLLRMLLASRPQGVRSALAGCRSIEIGSAAVSAAELQQLMTLLPGARVFLHYGLTECSRAVILDTRQYPHKLDTAGRPAPGVTISIRDESNQALGQDQAGQIFVRGPQLAEAYWRQPELSAERFSGGWLATGDYGSVDADGFVRLLGRRDDMINCGGRSFFPAEVEQALGTPDGVEQVLVAGVPDPRGVLQEVPWAFVVPTDAAGWTPEALLASARRGLPSHMVPRRVVAVSALPLTASGKPDRRRAVELYGPAKQDDKP
jgi:acyl-CoA synthetase (AMP-forming)/AMP-acid ligase II